MISIVKSQILVKDLSTHFEVVEPKVIFAKAGSRRCWYYPHSNEISIAVNHADYNCVLHEFTHALVKKENGNPINHSDMFAVNLIKVVDYYYKGKINRYPFKWEYPTIKRFYESFKGD